MQPAPHATHAEPARHAPRGCVRRAHQRDQSLARERAESVVAHGDGALRGVAPVPIRAVHDEGDLVLGPAVHALAQEPDLPHGRARGLLDGQPRPRAAPA